MYLVIFLFSTTCIIHKINNLFIHLRIRLFAAVTIKQGALVIGGYVYDLGDRMATVACYSRAGWSKLDDLQSARNDHRAIINVDKIYNIAGRIGLK